MNTHTTTVTPGNTQLDCDLSRQGWDGALSMEAWQDLCCAVQDLLSGRFKCVAEKLTVWLPSLPSVAPESAAERSMSVRQNANVVSCPLDVHHINALELQESIAALNRVVFHGSPALTTTAEGELQLDVSLVRAVSESKPSYLRNTSALYISPRTVRGLQVISGAVTCQSLPAAA